MANPRVTAADLKPRLSKFGVDLSGAGAARRTRNGIRYGSQLEATAAAYLEVLHPEGLQRQVAFPMVVAGRTVALYRADFVYGLEVYEAKGKMMPDARIKLNLLRALYPQFRLWLITKGSGSTPLHIEEWK